MIAAERGNLEIARMLVAKGADPNMQDRSGASALSLAQVRGNRAMVELLSSAPK
jgi:ankyrin repeat protein